ncbi:10017_t:CDS:2 [Entrophospora sp. SA101]|nr:11442_t:CDS:2 [Entrophospora sp. SA101]CAJ0838570.1 10017_t:CDS:2 [Entrophospora sp. SA101]
MSHLKNLSTVQNLTTIINVTSDAENNEHTLYESPPPQPPCSPIKNEKQIKTSTSNELRNVANDSSVVNENDTNINSSYNLDYDPELLINTF